VENIATFALTGIADLRALATTRGESSIFGRSDFILSCFFFFWLSATNVA